MMFSRVKICPRCTYIPNAQESPDMYECRYCGTEMKTTKVFEKDLSNNLAKLIIECRQNPLYDEEEEKRMRTRMGKEVDYQLRKMGLSKEKMPALTKCPFCEGELTTVHKICPHCNRNVEGKLERPTPPPTLTTCPICQGKLSTAATACPHCGQPMNQGKPVQAVQQAPVQPKREKNVPRCPTCNSTNIRKLDVIDKGLSFAVWGIFSSKIGKSMMCKNCGYKW